MRANTLKAEQGNVQYHIDRIPDKVLTMGICVGVVVLSVVWLVLVGSTWT